MGGADVFTMDPAEAHKAVNVMFEVEAEADQLTASVCEESEPVVEVLTEADAAVGTALREAAEWWRLHRSGGFTRLVGSTGEYLATCAEEAVEIEDYNAGAFASLGDHARYPGRDSANASARPDW